MNPFCNAIKNSIWQKLVKSLKFSSTHMIANNATLQHNAMILDNHYAANLNDRKVLLVAIRDAIYQEVKQRVYSFVTGDNPPIDNSPLDSEVRW